jgi:hypothetical protein
MRVVNIRKEPYDVYIGRPSIWGNRFIIGPDGTREEVVQKFKDWVQTQPDLIEKAKMELKDKTLGCYCFPLACHGNVWIEIVEGKV